MEDREQVQIVSLKGDRKGEEIEIREHPALLERQQQLPARRHRLPLVEIGQEGAVSGDLRLGVENLEDGLKPEVGHRHRVDIGVNDASRDIAPAVAREEHTLASDSLLRAFTLQHSGNPLTSSGKSLT